MIITVFWIVLSIIIFQALCFSIIAWQIMTLRSYLENRVYQNTTSKPPSTSKEPRITQSDARKQQWDKEKDVFLRAFHLLWGWFSQCSSYDSNIKDLFSQALFSFQKLEKLYEEK